MLEPLLHFCLLIVLIVGLPMLPTFLCGLWEKRMIWPYAPIDEPAEIVYTAIPVENNPYVSPQAVKEYLTPQPILYSMNAIEQAQSCGFELKNVFRDAKGSLYRVRYNFMRSPEGKILALIGHGTVARIPIRGIHLMTFLADMRCLVTLNNSASSLWDMTGTIDECCIPNSDFEKLLDIHEKRVAASPVSPVQLPETDPVSELHAFRIRWVDLMERMGLVRFLDPQRKKWRYSIKGAFIFSIRAQFIGLRRLFWPDSRKIPRR
jgi:hypothetical protein